MSSKTNRLAEQTGRFASAPAETAAPLSPPASHPAAPAAAVVLSERAITGITALGHAVCHLGELVFTGVMLAVMHEFGLEPHQATALALLGYVLMGVGAIPVGLWSDAWGPLRVLSVYFVSMAAAATAVALAPNIWFLFAALTALGLAASIYHPAGLAMISLGVKRRGRAMGINGVAGSIGVAGGPLLGAMAAAAGMWRMAYVVLAVVSLAAVVALRVAARQGARPAVPPTEPATGSPPPGHNGSSAQAGPGEPRRGPEGDAELQRQRAERLEHERLLAAAGKRRYLALALLFGAMMLGGFNYRCLVTALPSFLAGDTAGGKELAQGGLFAFIALAVGGLGQYFGGWMGDRHGSARVYLTLVALLAPLALLLGFLGGAWLAMLVAALLAFCLFGQQPVENALLAERTTAGRRSRSYGTKFALTFGVGAAGAQVTGLVWHHFGSLAPVFYLVAGSAALMALLVIAAHVGPLARKRTTSA